MGELIKTYDVAVRMDHPSPAPQSGFAVAIRQERGRRIAELVIGLGGLLIVAFFMAMALMTIGSHKAVIDAKDAHIASLERANEQLADANARLADANDNLTEVATKTIVGLSPEDFLAFGSWILIAVGMALICYGASLAPIGGTFVAIGAILLVAW